MAETGTPKQNMERSIERGAAQMRETSDRLSASTDQTAQIFENSFQATANAIKDYNLKVAEFTQANLLATFDHARQLVSAKSPSETFELWTKCCSKQVETFAEQAKELTALGQKLATEAAEPLSKRLH